MRLCWTAISLPEHFLKKNCSVLFRNIAEGCARGSNADFQRFLQMAMGSASELEYHMMLSRDLNLVRNQDYEKTREQIEEVKKMLSALIRKIALDRV